MGRRDPSCQCKAWTELPEDRQVQQIWQFLHSLAHSRVPFTRVVLADLVPSVPDAEVRSVISIALDRDWIENANLRDSGGKLVKGSYMGMLARRR